MRGLKPTSGHLCRFRICVAPRAGAWIETRSMHHTGLLSVVAPRAGAWIETSWENLIKSISPLVAPHRGAWIETLDWRIPEVDKKVAPHRGALIKPGYKSITPSP